MVWRPRKMASGMTKMASRLKVLLGRIRDISLGRRELRVRLIVSEGLAAFEAGNCGMKILWSGKAGLVIQESIYLERCCYEVESIVK